MASDCIHDIVDYGYAETDREVRQGVFQTNRIRQTKCRLCGTIFNNKLDIDAAASNRNDGSFGVFYEEL